MTGKPYTGPVLVATPAEAALIFAVFGLTDHDVGGSAPEVVALMAKCRAVMDADPRWKQPLR